MKKTTSEEHFDSIAMNYDFYKNKNFFYYKNLETLLGSLIPKGKKVFEVGCGTGNLLVSTCPKSGYGMDISRKMVAIAKSKNKLQKNIKFSTSWPLDHFDYIFMSDVIEHLKNPKKTLYRIVNLMRKNTIFILTMANPIWEPMLFVVEKIGLKMPEGPYIRIKSQELKRLMKNVGFRIIKNDHTLLMPINIPFLSNFINRFLEKPFKKFAFIEYFIAIKA